MKSNTNSVSFHPKLAAAMDVVFGCVFLWWLTALNVWWAVALWFLFRTLLWVALVRLVYYPPAVNRWLHLLSLLIFAAGALSLLLFIEWRWSWWAVGIVFALFPAVSFWFLPTRESELLFAFKPYRRWRFLLSAFGLAGIWSGFAAIPVFQLIYDFNDWLWKLAGVAVSTALAFWWWREYGVSVNRRRLFAWLAALFVINLEAAWIVLLWPLGYLAVGLLLTWLWYLLWLLGRFHLSTEGIIWKKQQWFLSVNAVLLLVFLLLLVRWK